MRGAGWRLRSLLTAAAVAAGLLTGVVGASSAAASDAGTLVSSINTARRSAGLAPLSSTSALASVARSWAASMAASQQLAHNPRLTSQVTRWRELGENVGTGGSAPAIHSAFMGSAPHRANILSSRYTQVGVGVASGGGQLWVVEVFRLPSGASTPTSTTAPTSTTSTASRTSTRRTTQHTVTTRPATRAKPTTKPTTKPTPKPARVATRSASAAPAAAPSPPTLAEVLERARLAVTASADPAATWAWLMRLLGVWTAIGA